MGADVYTEGAMKPRRDLLAKQLSGVDETLIDAHLARLGDDYFAEFTLPEVVRHLRHLSRLSAERPVAVLAEPAGVAGRRDGAGDEPVECTILAADHPGLFALITGVLAAGGFTIDSGAAYTYGRAASEPPAGRHVTAGARAPRRAGAGRGARRGRPLRRSPAARAMIVNRFVGRRVAAGDGGPSVAAWRQQTERLLTAALADVERGAPEDARRRVSELVADAIRTQWQEPPVLHPVEIDIADLAGAPATRMRIVAEDTPLFLYSLAAALALHGVVIQRVRIRTVAGRVEDVIDVVDQAGSPISDPVLLDQLKLSILLTKQFAYFIGVAPDPYAALRRFEQLAETIADVPAEGQLAGLLADPRVMGGLALLLGSSEFLWEDFIRRQYETLLPMLTGQRRAAHSDDATVAQRLESAVAAASTAEDKVAALNAFKDREAFLIDLDHILDPDASVTQLARRLTRLAECVVESALRLAEEELRPRFGTARTLGGIATRPAVLGLGKLGGGALGYASDIELMFVFSDHGYTTGPEQIGNADYYERLAQATVRRISAKREGIFEVDLRLRPYGAAGPRAVSLESFADYYGPGGAALAYERLALIRLRTVAGDRALGARMERLRDELVYRAGAIPLDEVHEMRRRQLAEHGSGDRLNAKFSAGALVDVEYAVQMLQVRYGPAHAALRTSSVRRALRALAEEGMLPAAEAEQVRGAYDFYRRLINALRMWRGSARDLHLPPAGSAESGHLARRMGYRDSSELTAAQRLHLELEQRRADVRSFIDAHLGHGVLGAGSVSGIGDLALLLSEAAEPPPEAAPIFRRLGFAQPQRAVVNLTRLARRAPDVTEFARLAVLAADQLAVQSDPDRALNNWERYVAALGSPEHHFQLMLLQPMRLDLLVRIFATSQFLADALVRSPELFDWVTEPQRLHRRRRIEDVVSDLDFGSDWLARVDAVRRREILRIAIRDYCLAAPATDVMHELSVVAEALIGAAVDKLTADQPAVRARACVLAFGKLGGQELNYSSDIDLVALYDDRDLPESQRGAMAQAVGELARSLDRVLAGARGRDGRVPGGLAPAPLRRIGRTGALVQLAGGVLRWSRQRLGGAGAAAHASGGRPSGIRRGSAGRGAACVCALRRRRIDPRRARLRHHRAPARAGGGRARAQPAAPRTGHQVGCRRHPRHRVPGAGAAVAALAGAPGTGLRQHGDRAATVAAGWRAQLRQCRPAARGLPLSAQPGALSAGVRGSAGARAAQLPGHACHPGAAHAGRGRHRGAVSESAGDGDRPRPGRLPARGERSQEAGGPPIPRLLTCRRGLEDRCPAAADRVSRWRPCPPRRSGFVCTD